MEVQMKPDELATAFFDTGVTETGVTGSWCTIIVCRIEEVSIGGIAGLGCKLILDDETIPEPNHM